MYFTVVIKMINPVYSKVHIPKKVIDGKRRAYYMYCGVKTTNKIGG